MFWICCQVGEIKCAFFRIVALGFDSASIFKQLFLKGCTNLAIVCMI